jgi:Flp pilus assembly protein TadG
MRWLRNRRNREEGAALVEAAICLPVLMLLVLGLLEYGNYFKNNMSARNAASDAAREVSASSNDGQADFNGLKVAQRDLAGLDSGQLLMMVIYKANGPGESVPAECKVASEPGVCNHYTAAQVAAIGSGTLTESSFGASDLTDTTLLDFNFPPRARQYHRTVDGALTVAYVGVYVEANYHSVTGMIKTQVTLSGDSIVPIEPRAA